MQTCLNSAVGNTKVLAKLANASGNSMYGKNVVEPRIAHLLFRGCPTAIIKIVALRIVNAVQRATRGAIAHIRQKILKHFPAFTHGYASASVILPAFVLGVGTASEHTQPHLPQLPMLSCGISVCGPPCSDLLGFKTTARLRMSITQITVPNDYCFPAIALANPPCNLCSAAIQRQSFFDDFESSKPFSDERYFGGHNDGPFIVVSSGDGRGQPASLRNSTGGTT